MPSSFFSHSLQDSSLVDEVLVTMVTFAEKLNIDNYTRELALESYTELMDLLDFMILPDVLRRQAECLMNLVTILTTSYIESSRSLSILSLIMHLVYARTVTIDCYNTYVKCIVKNVCFVKFFVVIDIKNLCRRLNFGINFC